MTMEHQAEGLGPGGRRWATWWWASVAAGMVLLAAGCQDSASGPYAGRTVEQCGTETCACERTEHCPGEMVCVNGACAAHAPVTTDAAPSETHAGDAQLGDGAGDVGPADGAVGDADSAEPKDGVADGAKDGDAGTADAGPAPGSTGAPCKGNPECDSGWCVDSAAGGYCAGLCADGCPTGWACKEIVQLGDPVGICVRDESRLCLPCETDLHCGAGGQDRCLEVGGGHFCGKSCDGAGACPDGYTCQQAQTVTGETASQCVPDNGACDCTPEKEGVHKACTADNDLGVCVGQATCDPAQGWVGCDAPVPAEEACNGADDDCDGQIDEGQVPSTCEVSNDEGTCTGERTCQGINGWVCSASTPAAEACDGLDNDCDGETDEDFLDASGKMTTVSHCGGCGIDCQAKFDHAAEDGGVACDASGATPTCVLVACEPGYILFGGSTCLSIDATLCDPCQTDDDCYGEGSRCLQVSPTDPRTFCGRDCAAGTAASIECPDTYACTDVEPLIGVAGSQCMPVSGSCDCTEANAGQVKACALTNALGTCFGQETCDPAQGWVGCTAATPADETCNGVDDDCDGLVDEDVSVGEACESSNEAGTCTGVTYCSGQGGVVCSALTPADELCDGLDNDCDGETDEGFATTVTTAQGEALKYGLTTEHCGACGHACPPVDHGTVRCDAAPDVPVCAVDTCDEGFFDYLGVACLPVPTSNSCAPCGADEDCGGPADRCVDEGGDGSFCARDCAAGSVYGTAATPCSGATGEQGCCPDGYTCEAHDGGAVCRPLSGSCTCSEDGYVDSCAVTNALGTCFGTRTCSLTGAAPGWSACTAGTPSVEVCNNVDDDCDGAVDALDDSLDFTTTPDGGPSCQTGPACTGTWKCAAGGWVCSAAAATPEICDGADNDCDGETDEDFLSGGQYLDNANCGGCGVDCAAVIPNATTTACVTVAGAPTCVATACPAGTFPYAGGVACLSLPDNLCQACTADSDCLVPSSRCVDGGGERYCGRSCAAGSDYGAACPGGYTCQDVGDGQGGADLQCVPTSGTCLCGAATVGLKRSCDATPPGGGASCVGQQVCQDLGGGSYALSACSAEGLFPEVCDGQDNDCDGQTDEGFVGPGGAYDGDTDCGQCGNNCLLRWNQAVHHATGTCDATHSPPACVIASCGTESSGGADYEWVDTNGLDADGCECRRVQGNTATDLPDLDFGGYPTADATYVDDNCDGVDGVVTDALFVRSSAAAGGDGSLAAPFQHIGDAVAAFPSSGKSYILVAGGNYAESIDLAPGLQLHGGYAPDFHSRNIATFSTRITGAAVTASNPPPPHGVVHAQGLTGAQTIVSGFVIVGRDQLAVPTAAGTAGTSSYAVTILDSDSSLILRNNRIVGGLGGPGAPGAAGAAGFGANNVGGGALHGGNGHDAGTCTNGVCAGASQAGGAAGTNPSCPGANGIQGGGVTCPIYNTAAYSPPDPSKDGASGWSWTRDSGTDNSCGSHATEAGFPTAIELMSGGPGQPGDDGVSGLQGAGGKDPLGSFGASGWSAAPAATGAAGTHGARGGTGGASGGLDTASAAEMPAGVNAKYNDRYILGATGGGAGAGGCGGTGGGAGGAGGASVAVLVGYTAAPAAGASPPVLADNVITRGGGGAGADGGLGGAGGAGGDGGVGGDSNGFWIDFRAGDGGRGGAGGVGGGGGGGAGGASFGLAVFAAPGSWSLSYDSANTFPLPEATVTGGPGGSGGPSGQASAASDGVTGTSRNYYLAP